MLYSALVDISDIGENDVDFLREKIKIHFTEKVNLKKKDSVCAKAVLCKMLEDAFGLKDYLINSDENEKPYLVRSNLHFNLSHSGNYVLCVCGDERVGCDIQIIKSYNEKIAKRFFTCDEYNVLCVSDCKETDFTRLWTLKESVLKLHGTGISGGLDSFDFSKYYCEDSFFAYGLNFNVIAVAGYIQSICSETGNVLTYNVKMKDLLK